MKNKISVCNNFTVTYKVLEGQLNAVDRIEFGLEDRKVTALIGESGCGKSTIIKAIFDVLSSNGTITEGDILYKDKSLLKLSEEGKRQIRWRDISTVFQAAQNSLNPTMSISEQFLDVFEDHDIKKTKREKYQKVREVLSLVNLEAERVMQMYPHQLSGGMKQRVIIAMSLVLDPDVLILDEPTTALDLITQAQIMGLLADIKKKLHLTMLIVSHDLANVAKLADNITVMYAGQILETGTDEDIFYHSVHPYTRGLINSIPSIIGDQTGKKSIPGDTPSLLNPPKGCKFHPRCEFAEKICSEKEPEMIEISGKHKAACHRYQYFLEQKGEK